MYENVCLVSSVNLPNGVANMDAIRSLDTSCGLYLILAM